VEFATAGILRCVKTPREHDSREYPVMKTVFENVSEGHCGVREAVDVECFEFAFEKVKED
jgi:hypothetical protein